jgi:hypothetical protein
MQQMIFIADLIACSSCFGHHYAHHQELESIVQVVAGILFPHINDDARSKSHQITNVLWLKFFICLLKISTSLHTKFVTEINLAEGLVTYCLISDIQCS